jgi:isopenicillin-N epimerase
MLLRYLLCTQRVHAQRQPLRFIDRELLPHLANTVRQLAAHVGASPTDCFLLPNATAGLNTVLRSLGQRLLQQGDAVLLLDTAYGSVKKMVRELCGESQGATVIELKVPFPLTSEDDIVAAVGRALDTQKGKRIKLAVFDHITSASGLTLPVQKLVQLCHDHGVQASLVTISSVY